MNMRLDKFLKVSRLIKRRPIAKEIRDNGHILINGRVGKAGSEVKENDILELHLGSKIIKAKILKVMEYAKKEDADSMFEILENTNA